MALGDFTLTNAALTTATVISFNFNNPVEITHSTDLTNFGAGAAETSALVTLPTPIDMPPLTSLEFNAQYFTATLVNGFYYGDIVVNAQRGITATSVTVTNTVELYSVTPPPPDPDPNYAINTDPPGVTQISEGSTVNFRVTTVGVATGTVLYWTTVLQGGATVADFADATLQGTVTIDSIGEGVIARPIATDGIDDPGENFYLELRVIDYIGTITAYSPPVIILTPYVPPPYDGGGGYDGIGTSPSSSPGCTPGSIGNPSNNNSCTAPSGDAPAGDDCFTADTLITMADGTVRPIVDVTIGDSVLSADGQTVNTVKFIEIVPDSDWGQLFSPDKKYKPFATINHPLIFDGKLHAVDPEMSFNIYPWLGPCQQLKDPIIEPARGELVYNLWVDGDGTYTVNGYGTTSIMGSGDFLSRSAAQGFLSVAEVVNIMDFFTNKGKHVQYGGYLVNKILGSINKPWVDRLFSWGLKQDTGIRIFVKWFAKALGYIMHPNR